MRASTRTSLMSFVFALATMASATARAEPCAGFVDIDTTSPYCSGAQWMKARAITLGCDATHYCPNDGVSRAAMALFMQRLGTAISPQFYATHEAIATNGFDNGEYLVYCQLAIPAATYPRNARTTITWQGATYPKSPTMRVAYKTTGTWSYTGAALYMQAVDNSGLANVAYAASQTMSAPAVALAANTAYTFGLWLTNGTGGSAFFNSSSCFLDVIAVSG